MREKDSIIVYDLEILRCIPGQGDMIPGIEYCGGWHDHKSMGISVLAAYDYQEKATRVFCADNLQDFITLANQRKYRVSFNGKSFDDKVLEAAGFVFNENSTKAEIPFNSDYSTHYDILLEMIYANGAKRDKGIVPAMRKGLKLDAISQANGGKKKTEDGALAPVMWQQGKIGRVIDYCINDVMMTKQLLDQIIYLGELINPNTGKPLTMESPW